MKLQTASVVAFVLLGSIAAVGEDIPIGPPNASKLGVAKQVTTIAGRSFSFVENRGQFDPSVKFQAKSGGNVLWFTSSGIVVDVVREKMSPHSEDMTLRRPSTLLSAHGQTLPPTLSKHLERLVFREEFTESNKDPRITACLPSPGTYNYFFGKDQSKWRSNIHSYSELIYHNLWPRIDVRYTIKNGDIEQEFLVRPGADPNRIRIGYKGIDGLGISRDGSLFARTASGTLRESRPEIYQEIDGKRNPAKGRFVLIGTSSYAFRVAAFDRKRLLVIDPTLLYSTYLGGNNSDYGNAIAADSGGNAYVAGVTNSSNFPTTAGAFQTTFPGYVAFVTKLSPAGLPIYSTFLGSSLGSGGARGVAVNATGEAYITGNTGGEGGGDGTFPTTANAFQGGCDASTFLTKLSAAGNSLLYSTCLGAEGFWNVNGVVGATAIALDSAGRAYLAGTSATIPTTPGAYQQTLTGSSNAFLSILNPSLPGSASLVYSSFLGGSASDFGYALAVDAYRNAYIAGLSRSYDFPTTPGAFQTSNKQGTCRTVGSGFPYPCGNAFIAKFNPAAAGSASLIYSTLLGGSSDGRGTSARGIAVDGSGSAYVAGYTGDTDFPATPGAFQTTPSGGIGFITKLNAGGSHLSYSSFIEGTPENISGVTPFAVTLDDLGNAYVVGNTSTLLPVTADAFQPTFHGGDTDAFLLEFNPQGTDLIYGSYLGGRANDSATAVALDSTGDVYLTGSTLSFDFPITPDAFQPNLGGGQACSSGCTNAFVTKFPLGAPGELSVSEITPSAGGNAGTVSPQIFGRGFRAGATVKLSCGGSDIDGTNVVASAGGRLLNTTFDLTKAEASTCDVVVTDIDGTSTRLAHSFTIRPGGAPILRVTKLGTPARKPPLDQPTWSTNVSYLITVTNTGNVDAGGVVSESLDPEFSVTSVSPSAAAGLSTINADSLIAWPVSQLAPGGTQRFLYSTTVDLTTPVGTSLIGGPSCFVSKVDKSNLCIVTIPSSCTVSTSSCCQQEKAACFLAGAATVACLAAPPPINVVCYALAFAGTCYACAGMSKDCVSCSPGNSYITNCLQDNADSCSSYIESLEGGAADPNDLVGPTGAGRERWVSGAQAFPYIVSFGNEATATAPAQRVVVTQSFDPNLDLSTLSLAGVTIPNRNAPAVQIAIPTRSFNPAVGLNEFTTTVDLRPAQSILVSVDAKLNPATETITWTFTSIDPATGLPYPFNLAIGFLPPASEASVLFTIRPKQDLTTGTKVPAQASVVFNANKPIGTNAWSNSMDNTPPKSHMSPLSSQQSAPNFPVSWSGTDVGSGIQSYTIYFSDNGGPFKALLTNTTSTSDTYTGVVGHTYGFYSIARDLVGNAEAAKTVAEATTTVQKSSTCATDVSSQVAITRGGFRLNHATKSFVQTVTVTNNGPSLSGASLVMDSLSSNATLSNPGGTTKCDAPIGSPWIALPRTLGTGQSASITLTFSDPTMTGIQYSTRVLAGSGQK